MVIVDSHVTLPQSAEDFKRTGEKETGTLTLASKYVEQRGCDMKIGRGVVTGIIAGVFVAANPGVSAPLPNATGVRTQIVITVRSAQRGSPPESLVGGD